MKPTTPEKLKTYPAPWKGNVILACQKCQKKLRKADNPAAFAKMKKWIKARSRKDDSARLRVIEIPCQDICPKGGVVVLGPAELAARPSKFAIITSEKQMETFYNCAKRANLECE